MLKLRTVETVEIEMISKNVAFTVQACLYSIYIYAVYNIVRTLYAP